MHCTSDQLQKIHVATFCISSRMRGTGRDPGGPLRERRGGMFGAIGCEDVMRVRRAFAALLWIGSVSLTACGGGGDSSAPVGPPPSAPAAAPTVTLNYGIKQLQFSWAAVSGATHYRLLERPDAAAAFAQVGADMTATSASHAIALHRRINAAYRVEACNSVGCTASSDVSLAANLLPRDRLLQSVEH